MDKNFVFILTEGDHDSAFIYRILKANGMKTDHGTAIKDYPPPLNDLIKSEIKLNPIEISDKSIKKARTKCSPSYIMKKDDNYVLIYGIGGDSNDKSRIGFITSIKDLLPQDPNAMPDPSALSALENTQISILFFMDADDKGVVNRIIQIKKELNESFSEAEKENINKLENREKCSVFGINIGAFIFTEENEDKGKLEDILIPLMEDGNNDIFDKAKDFLAIHKETALFKDNIEYYYGTKDIKKVNGEKYYYKKSLIGTVGQLQMSGKSNTVCISDSDYLNDNKITSNETCNDIYNFIQNLIPHSSPTSAQATTLLRSQIPLAIP